MKGKINTDIEEFNNGKKMRNAFIRISKQNIIKKSNEELGLKEGCTINFEKEDIIRKLDEWTKTRDIKYYLIEHNKDPENIHFHIVIDFPDNSSCTFKTLKNKFPYGSIDRCKYGLKGCVQYLVHFNNPEKEQYAWEEIVTNAPDRLEDYKIPGKKTTDAKLQHILDEIVSGNLRRFEIKKIEPELYIKYKNRIENAFDYREKKMLQSSDRNITVYVLQGPTGLGKSTFCKAWAMRSEQSIRFSSASNDPWQDYEGQDIFVYDDFNPTSTKIEDLMKSIDPYTNSTASGRYHNKLFLGDTIFITTNVDIRKWYKNADLKTKQGFLRRIDKVMEFEKSDENNISIIHIYHFNDSFDGLIHERDVEFDLAPYVTNQREIRSEAFNTRIDMLTCELLCE